MEPIHNNIVIAKQAVMVVLAFNFFFNCMIGSQPQCRAEESTDYLFTQIVCINKSLLYK